MSDRLLGISLGQKVCTLHNTVTEQILRVGIILFTTSKCLKQIVYCLTLVPIGSF